jgi:hypothetical protein
MNADMKAILGMATTQSLCLPFPLRYDYVAQIVVPRNLNAEEAEKLCVFIRTLAV